MQILGTLDTQDVLLTTGPPVPARCQHTYRWPDTSMGREGVSGVGRDGVSGAGRDGVTGVGRDGISVVGSYY